MYLDVDIAIQPRAGDSYPVTLHTPGGDARGSFVFPDDAEFHELLARLHSLKTDEAVLSRLGLILFEALFHGPTREVLARTQGIATEGQRLRLRLSIAAEEGKVAALPWELLYDPVAGPLTLTATPLLRSIPMAVRVPTVAAALPLRVLLTSGAGHVADTEPVMREIEQALAGLGHQVQITVERRLDVRTLQRRLREGHHVWHFVGLGSGAGGGSLLLSDGSGGSKLLAAAQLGALLHGSGVRLVMLDASPADRLQVDPFRTIAPALLRTQIPTIVAMQFSSQPEASQAFAGEFYRALAEGLPIDDCVTEGRRALLGASGLDRPDWAMPVVFSRAPDSQLFQVPQADLPGRIVTLGAANEQLPVLSVQVDSRHGSLLHGGTAPQVTRLEEQPRPPRAPRLFLNREREQRLLQAELVPGRGAWVRGMPGAGISTLLRQTASSQVAALADGVVLLNHSEPADAGDAVQELFERFYRSSQPAKPSTNAARTYLGALRSLFVFDRLPLPTAELVTLADTLAQGSLLVAGSGPAPDTLRDVQLGPLPRQEATRLLGDEAGIEIDLSNVVFLDRICAALGDLPLPLRLAGRLLNTSAVALKQLVSLAEAQREEPAPLVRAARIALGALAPAELRVLAAVVRADPQGLSTQALAEITSLDGGTLAGAVERLRELGLIEGDDPYRSAAYSLTNVLDRLLPAGNEKRRAAAFFAAAALAHPGDLVWHAANQGNVAQSIETLLANNDPMSAGALAQSLQPMTVLRGRWGQWGRLCDQAERAAKASGDRALQAWALHERGTRAGLLGNPGLASSTLAEAARLRQALGDTEGADFSLHNMRVLGLLAAPAVVRSTPSHRGRNVLLSLVALALLLAAFWWFGGGNWLRAAGLGSVPTAVPSAAPIGTEQPTAAPVATLIPSNTPTPTTTPTSAPTSTSTPTVEPVACTILTPRMNIRRGPGENFPVFETLVANTRFEPIGQNDEGDWLALASENGVGWLALNPEFITCSGPLAGLPVLPADAVDIPTDTPTPTETPTETPTATATPTSLIIVRPEIPPIISLPVLSPTATPAAVVPR